MKKLRLFDSLKFVLATVAFVFAIVPAHAATLPAGYTELEYIESTGTQYIDTGIKGNNNTSVEIRMRFPATSSADSSGRIFGARTNATTNGFAFGTSTGKIDTPLWFVSYGNQAYKNYTVSNYLNTWHKLAMQQNVLNVDDVTVATFTPETFETELNLLLFGYINSGTGTTVTNIGRYQCSYFKLWNGNTLVRDFVPARRDSDGVLGMYDTVSGQFFTNAGTGTFIAGEYPIKIATTRYNEEQFAPVKTDLSAAVNAVEYVVSNTMTQAQAIDTIATTKQTRPDEGCPAKYCLLVEDEDGTPHWYPIAGANGVAHALPAGYTELQYIESTGTQYIDTGIYGTEHHGMEIKYSYPTLDGAYSGRLCGGRTGTSATNAFAYIGTYIGTLTPTGNTFYVASNNGLTANLEPLDTNVHTASVNLSNNQKSYFDGQEIQGIGETTAYVHQFTTNLFRAYNGTSGWATPARARIYFCKITNSGELVRDFIPAKNASDVVGMYDMVSGQFFTNAGTGTFVAGPDM